MQSKSIERIRACNKTGAANRNQSRPKFRWLIELAIIVLIEIKSFFFIRTACRNQKEYRRRGEGVEKLSWIQRDITKLLEYIKRK